MRTEHAYPAVNWIVGFFLFLKVNIWYSTSCCPVDNRALQLVEYQIWDIKSRNMCCPISIVLLSSTELIVSPWIVHQMGNLHIVVHIVEVTQNKCLFRHFGGRRAWKSSRSFLLGINRPIFWHPKLGAFGKTTLFFYLGPLNGTHTHVLIILREGWFPTMSPTWAQNQGSAWRLSHKMKHLQT